tara:strand:- start:157 stop:993 length:837 start_codon:yes stop_codon:yes gene_type:complete
MAFKQNNNPLSRKSSPLNGDWIKGAIKRPGAFRKKAEEAGMSTKAFADKVIANKEDYSTRTGQQAELAETLMGMSRHESGHINPEQGDFDYEDPNYRDTPEYKKFLRKQKRQERKNKRKGPKRGEPGFEQDPQEAAMEQSYLETYGESISRKASPLNAGMGGELEEVVVNVDRDRSKKGIKERKTKDKEEGEKSKSEIRLDKTKDKVAKAKKATVESKDIESQKENRAKANRLRKRQIRQEGRAERKKARKSNKFRENKRQAIIKSRREQKEEIRDVK